MNPFTRLGFGVRTMAGELVLAPIWWYGGGLRQALERLRQRVTYANAYLGLSVWAKNLFVPMYGQWDIAGRIISFFVRLLQTIVRTVFFVGWVAVDIFLFLVYVFLPLVILWQISPKLTALLTR